MRASPPSTVPALQHCGASQLRLVRPPRRPRSVPPRIQRISRGVALASVSVGVSVGCGRTEEPPGRTAVASRAPAPEPELQATQATGGGPPAVAPKPTAQRCMIPLQDPPAPKARAANRCPKAANPGPTLPKAQVRFVGAPGKPSVEVEVAEQPGHRERGLMFRTKMGADQGMLFTWPQESQRSFWMRNTCLPLDMLFIAADGYIVGALEQVPVMNEAPRSIPCPAMHVLEVNAGYLREHGVRPGQLVEIARKKG